MLAIRLAASPKSMWASGCTRSGTLSTVVPALISQEFRLKVISDVHSPKENLASSLFSSLYLNLSCGIQDSEAQVVRGALMKRRQTELKDVGLDKLQGEGHLLSINICFNSDPRGFPIEVENRQF